MKLEVLKNTLIQDKRYLLELAVPAGFKKPIPGQFVHIRLEDSCDPLLRRPLSIHNFEKSKIKILYEVVGKGTNLLSQKKSSNVLDILGPLGNGFDLKRISSTQNIFIVAGGMGVAPLFFLTKKIMEIKNKKLTIKVLIGAKTKEHVVCEKEFKKLGCSVHVATDDGSKGFKGKVTDLLKKNLLSTIDHTLAGTSRLSTICACGPKLMLAAIADISRTDNVPAFVSLEEFMGCGLGACLGCVIRTTAGYRRICHDGPVFDAREIIWKD